MGFVKIELRKSTFVLALSLLVASAHASPVTTSPTVSSANNEGYWAGSNPSSYQVSSSSNSSQVEAPFKEETKVATGLILRRHPVIFTSVPKDPVLGEGWRGPDGLIWFDIATDNQGTPIEMDHQDAIEYCEKNNARLPSFNESSSLRLWFSGHISEFKVQYTPQILPHPAAIFWTAMPDLDQGFTFRFIGEKGTLEPAEGDFLNSVRCVRNSNDE